MIRKTINSIALVAAIIFMSLIIPPKKITVWMIGDSTMSIKQPKAFPETGWGMEFPAFFDESVTVANLAMNGRSTQSFRSENRWQPVLDGLKEGDYVFIEFGHNDEKVDKPNVGTSLQQFKANLVQYVVETRERKGIPVLMTPIARRSFKDGVLQDTHKGYPDVVRQVADSLKVPMIDMLQKTSQLLTKLGEQGSIQLFNYVAPGHVNYPEGKKDDTHLSPEGAKQVAALAAEGIKELKLELATRLLPQKQIIISEP